MKKACVALTIALCLLVTAFVPVQADAAGAFIQVKINGTELKSDTYPTVINGCTMVPMRAIFEALGAEIEWDADMNLVSAVKDDTKVSIRVNSKFAYINGKETVLQSVPILLDGSTVVPVRFIAESLGAKVNWDAENRIVDIRIKTSELEEDKPEPVAIKEYTLDKDTVLEYRPGCSAEFKKGTTIYLHDYGMVKSGTLKEDYWVKPTDDRSANGCQVRFKGDTEVTFYENGNLKTGILVNTVGLKYADIDNIRLDLIPSRTRDQVNFKGDTEITFNENGYAAEGIMASDAVLQYSPYNALYFNGDNKISFNDEGYVIYGTLSNTTTLSYKENKTVMLKDRTPVEFNENNYVVKGTLKQDTKLEYQSGYVGEVEFEKDTDITFRDDGYVKSGTLLEDTSLHYAEGKSVTFKKETQVTFHDNGYVRSGTLSNTTSIPAADGTYQNCTGGSKITFDKNGYVPKQNSEK